MIIISFTGMPGSGKTEAVQTAKHMGFPVVRMGDAVWEEVTKRGLELNDQNVGAVADTMRKTHGKDIWAKRTLKKIKSLSKTEVIVIDGIRNIEEILLFKKELGKEFLLIAIEASAKIRHQRELQRGRTDDATNLKDLEIRDHREAGWGLGGVIGAANMVISNEGQLEDFQKTIQTELQKYLF